MSELGTTELQARVSREARTSGPSRPRRRSLFEALGEAEPHGTGLAEQRDTSATATTRAAPRPTATLVVAPEAPRALSEPRALGDVGDEQADARQLAPASSLSPHVALPWLKAKRRAQWRLFFVDVLAWLMTLLFIFVVLGGAAFVLARLGGQ